MSEPRGVPKRCVDIERIKCRILPEDLLAALAGVEVILNDGDHDSRALDARLAVTDLGVDRDSIPRGASAVLLMFPSHCAFPIFLSDIPKTLANARMGAHMLAIRRDRLNQSDPAHFATR
jgi:hypothetical protein